MVEFLNEIKRENYNEMTKLNLLFLKYLMINGLDDESVRNILEVGSSVDKSLSLILPKDRYNQYLVSTKVNMSELNKHKIYGENGLVYHSKVCHSMEDIVLSENGDKLLNSFDTLLSSGFSNEKRHAIYSLNEMKKFIGQCISYNKKDKQFYDTLYKSECEYINSECCSGHSLITDVDSEENVGYYLILKK